MSENNINNLLGMARTATASGNSAEATTYYNRVLEIDPSISEAWIGKGRAAAWQSSLANLRFNEMIVAFGNAIGCADEDLKDTVVPEAVEETNKIVVALYQVARNHMMEYVSLDSSWSDYVSQVAMMIDSLKAALNWMPYDRTTLENIIYLAGDNISGVSYRDEYDNGFTKVRHVAPDYEVFLNNEISQAEAALKSIDPAYEAPKIEKKSADACFVVTAVMGDFKHPDTIALRNFRDRILLRNKTGRYVVAAYYKVGPRAANYIGKKPRAKQVVRHLIVKPSAALIRRWLD